MHYKVLGFNVAELLTSSSALLLTAHQEVFIGFPEDSYGPLACVLDQENGKTDVLWTL